MATQPNTGRPATEEDIRDLISLQEAAEMCTVDYDTFLRWVAKDILPHVVIGPNRIKRVRRAHVLHIMRFVDPR